MSWVFIFAIEVFPFINLPFIIQPGIAKGFLRFVINVAENIGEDDEKELENVAG